MSVVAKFICVTKSDNHVQFDAVISGSEENKEFWRYTPAGQISMHIDNEAALNQFIQGEEYYVSLVPAK